MPRKAAAKSDRYRAGGGRRYSGDRFRALAIYILMNVEIDPRELFYVMFLADQRAYRQNGKSLTGTVWVKTHNGVEPRPRRRRAKAAK